MLGPNYVATALQTALAALAPEAERFDMDVSYACTLLQDSLVLPAAQKILVEKDTPAV